MCLRSALSLLQRVTSRPSLTGREDRGAAACGYPQSIYIWSQWWEVCSFFSIYELLEVIWTLKCEELSPCIKVCTSSSWYAVREGGDGDLSALMGCSDPGERVRERWGEEFHSVCLRTRDLWGETHHRAPRFVWVIYFTQHANEGLTERC